jgi:drug/metabolite transporter (DMT)-like permease
LRTDRHERVGVVLAAVGALSYGVTVVVGEDLADAGLGPGTALGVRFSIGGLILAVVLRIRRVALVPSRREVVVGLVLGVAYAIEATLFFSALERGTAAAVALIVYVYPAIVTVVELARGNERARRSTFVALAMSMTGTAIVVVGGGRVAITPVGVVFALGSATAFSVYLLTGRELTKRSDPMVIACWVALGAGVSNLARGAVTQELVNPSSRTLEIVVYGLATAIAFTLTFAAMQRIGASRVAVVMTLEAASSVVMAAIFLGESVKPLQALGGVAVLAAAAVIARGQPDMAGAIEAAPAAGT